MSKLQGPKGQESIAQGLPRVSVFLAACPAGAPESKLQRQPGSFCYVTTTAQRSKGFQPVHRRLERLTEDEEQLRLEGHFYRSQTGDNKIDTFLKIR